jgi:hypothetical protein
MLADIALPHKFGHLSLQTCPRKQLLEALVCGMCAGMAANGAGVES